MFEPMDEKDAAVLLINTLEAPITAEDERKGTPHVFRALGVENLVRTAEQSERRETVEVIAEAFRRLGYRRELEGVERKLRSMPLGHDDSKRSPFSRPPGREPTGPQKLILK